MALTLGGSKRWPKWTMLQRFARTQCGLKSKAIETIVEEVEQAAVRTLPLVQAFGDKHDGFKEIADSISELLKQKTG